MLALKPAQPNPQDAAIFRNHSPAYKRSKTEFSLLPELRFVFTPSQSKKIFMSVSLLFHSPSDLAQSVRLARSIAIKGLLLGVESLLLTSSFYEFDVDFQFRYTLTGYDFLFRLPNHTLLTTKANSLSDCA